MADKEVFALEIHSIIPAYEQSRDGQGKFIGHQVTFAPIIVSSEALRALPLDRPYKVLVSLVDEALE